MILCSYSEISGFHGVLAGMLVAIKQLTPETEITVLQIVKLRAKVRRPPSPLVAFHMHQLCAHAIAGLVCILLIVTSRLMNCCPFGLQHLAALYVLTASVLSVLTHRAVATIPFVMCGALSAWVYLRLYQPSPTDASQQCAAVGWELHPSMTAAICSMDGGLCAKCMCTS
jgi:hypothetical protein